MPQDATTAFLTDTAHAAPAWRLSIDAGGTFTDCVAHAPHGKLRRAKVLTSGALRATVEGILGPRLLRVRHRWRAPSGFVEGFPCRIVSPSGDAGPPSPGAFQGRVVGFGVVAAPPTRSGWLADVEVDPALPAGLATGALFEVRSTEPAAVLAARLVTDTPPGAPLPPLDVRLGTTLATNLLLERRGAPTALFVTSGFADLLTIGTQQRPDLFALTFERPPPLQDEVVEVEGRIAADGAVLRPLALEPVGQRARRLVARGVRSAAVALVNGHANPAHERQLAEVLRQAGFTHVTQSSELSARMGYLVRTETAVVNAVLAPVLLEFLDLLRRDLGRDRVRIQLMTSAGGLAGADEFCPKDGLLSGPAGGVVGAARAARRSGFARVLTLDMGGTSTDVARFDGEFEYRFEHAVGGAYLAAPALAIESVAAGGGSVCGLAGGRLRVGPESAGGHPGPACYGSGGPLTLTDVNLLLGRLLPDRFTIPLKATASNVTLEALRGDLARTTGESVASTDLLAGLLQIANERMADAIRQVSVRRGYDPTDYALVAFGGAGPQHACAVAERLGVRTVVIPVLPAHLSAVGIEAAIPERFAERQVLQPLMRAEPGLAVLVEELATEARRALEEAGIRAGGGERRVLASLRLAGQESTLDVPWHADTPLGSAFAARYQALYGHAPEGAEIELESVRVVLSAPSARSRSPSHRIRKPQRRAAASMAKPSDVRAGAGRSAAFFGGEWVEVSVYERRRLRPRRAVSGPALIAERYTVTVVEPGWVAQPDEARALVLRRARRPVRRRRQASATHGAAAAPEAVRLELVAGRLRAVAVEMGEMLRRTARSVNVKERLDFSCGVLDREGNLVVNAPHIPVHLGGLGLCVRELAAEMQVAPGDVLVTNHPAFGGTHLPDVTVVTPVHRDDELIGYVASRAHHAEIGGARPGSLSPLATRLEEEGVSIPPMHLVRRGRGCFEELRRRLASGPFPSRSIEDNLADVRAAVAANRRGADLLVALADDAGAEGLHEQFALLASAAERGVREALTRLETGVYEGLQHLDDGSPLRVRITAGQGSARIDFGGSAETHPGCLNATPGVVRSVVMYVLRLLARGPLPLNEGLLRPVTLVLPAGILNPVWPADSGKGPAVGGGNVETSQRLVDLLLASLGVAACSQGTMNNVVFGGPAFAFYETVCGGCGAGADFDGPSAVHSHMTNTRITDVEVMERRYPVRVERFAVRAGSGGDGARRGGDGVVREITFLEPLSLSLLTQRRREGACGLAGGGAGQPGRQRLARRGGEIVELAELEALEVEPGDRLVLETPGGGGYGI